VNSATVSDAEFFVCELVHIGAVPIAALSKASALPPTTKFSGSGRASGLPPLLPSSIQIDQFLTAV
jgi:hypothetical protein